MTWSYLKIKEIQILIMLQNYSQVKLPFSEQRTDKKKYQQSTQPTVCKSCLQTYTANTAWSS